MCPRLWVCRRKVDQPCFQYNIFLNAVGFHPFWALLHPDFNTHTFGNCGRRPPPRKIQAMCVRELGMPDLLWSAVVSAFSRVLSSPRGFENGWFYDYDSTRSSGKILHQLNLCLASLRDIAIDHSMRQWEQHRATSRHNQGALRIEEKRVFLFLSCCEMQNILGQNIINRTFLINS